MKKSTLLALIFAFALGVFLYVYFGVVFIVFLPPLFVYIFNKYNKWVMNKELVTRIGIQAVVVRLVLTVFEFLIANSDIVVWSGALLIPVSLFVKSEIFPQPLS